LVGGGGVVVSEVKSGSGSDEDSGDNNGLVSSIAWRITPGWLLKAHRRLKMAPRRAKPLRQSEAAAKAGWFISAMPGRT